MRTFIEFLQEVNKNHLASVGERINKFTKKEIESEPFNNIFGDKYRIVIPFLRDEEENFLERLYELGIERDSIDFDDGTGKKAGKNVRLRIGKFLQQSKAEDKRDLLSFWEKNRDNLKRKDSGISVIVSRHPIDILRMSDHGEWTSCHSPGRSHWDCAVQEAKHGGAVAYVVKNSDLAKVKDKLQKKEIFQDDDRNIDGIEPLERLRLQRYHDDKNNYLVPVDSTYGIGHVGFYNTVKKWAFNAQKDILDNINVSKLKRRGGSYEDNGRKSAYNWSNFLGKDILSKNLSSQDESNTDEKGLEEGVAECLAQAEARLKYFSVHAEVEHDGENPYVYFNGWVRFSFKEISDVSLDWNSRNDLIRFLRKECDIYAEDVEIVGSNINISLSTGDYNLDLDGLENFIDSLADSDRDYDESNLKIYRYLQKQGFIELDFDYEFNNMEHKGYEIDDESIVEIFLSNEFDPIGNLQGMCKEDLPIRRTGSKISNYKFWMPHNDLERKFIQYIKKIEVLFAILTDNNIETSFSFNVKEEPNDDFYKKTDMDLREEYGDIPVYFEFELSFTRKMGESIYNKLKEYDKEIPHLFELAKKFFEEYKEECSQKQHHEKDIIKEKIAGLKSSLGFSLFGFKREKLTGEVVVKKMPNGSLFYYYIDRKNNIDMPYSQIAKIFESVHEKIKHINSSKYNISKDTSTWTTETTAEIENGKIKLYSTKLPEAKSTTMEFLTNNYNNLKKLGLDENASQVIKTKELIEIVKEIESIDLRS